MKHQVMVSQPGLSWSCASQPPMAMTGSRRENYLEALPRHPFSHSTEVDLPRCFPFPKER